MSFKVFSSKEVNLEMHYIISWVSFILLFISSNSEAQTYHPFPTDNAYWKYFGHNNGYYFLDYATYEVDGDTVFEDKIYSRVYETTQNTNTIIGSTDFVPRHFIGGLREANKIIYFYASQFGEDTVFDFNLGVGDTVAHIYYQFSGWQWLTISQIDSVQMLDGSFRKRFSFFPPLADIYIEGVGSSYSIFPNYTPPFGPGAVFFQLTCFKEHDSLSYYQSATEECGIITSVEQVSNANNGMSIHPNPFTSEVIIQFGKIIREGILQVRNPAGQIILSETKNNSDHEIIPAAYFDSDGIYFLEMKTEDEVYTSKLMYQH